MRAQADVPSDSAAVRVAARAWLALLDADQYEVTLDSAAPLLRQLSGSVEDWRQFLSLARGGVTAPVQRALVGSDAAPHLPGAPPGRYWQLTFAIVQGATRVLENVVLVQTPGGWRVAMYGLRGG